MKRIFVVFYFLSICVTRISLAAPIQITEQELLNYSLGGNAVTETFESFASGDYGGQLTLVNSVYVADEIRVSTENGQQAAFDNSPELEFGGPFGFIDHEQIFTNILVGTTVFQIDFDYLFPPFVPNNFEVTVIGGSGVSLFDYLFDSSDIPLFAFYDAAGIQSVTFQNFGAQDTLSNYYFDNVTTVATVPLPASIYFFITGVVGLLRFSVKERVLPKLIDVSN